MMNNITFEPLKDTDLQYACQLYEEAFPIEERRDTSEWLLQNKQNPLFNILCIKQNQTFQGILSYWTFESFTTLNTLPSQLSNEEMALAVLR